MGEEVKDVFYDKARTPSDRDLGVALGNTLEYWNELLKAMEAAFPPLEQEWVFSGKSHGWAVRLKQKKRAVLYMKPLGGYFRASFALGEKAVQAANESDLPGDVLQLIADAPKYPEGKAIRIEVRSRAEIDLIAKLAAIKMAN